MPLVPLGDTVDRRAEVLPPALLPLFDERFVRSWDLHGAYVRLLTARCARRLGLAEAADGQAVTAAELAQRCGYSAEGVTTVLDWMLRVLATVGDGRAEVAEGAARYVIGDLQSIGDPDEVRVDALAHDPGVAPAYELAEVAAEALPAFLSGEVTGERVLLAPDRLTLWGRYFSNDNPLYAINNSVGAEACVTSAPGGRLRLLEVGGGFGSAADALLARLEEGGRLGEVESYHFSELVPPFLRRGQRFLRPRWGDRVPLSFGCVDMDQPLAEQGVEAGSIDLLWAVNTLHVARDLGTTLTELHTALAPGGVLVAGECVRPFPNQALPPELVFNLLASFRDPLLNARWRSHGGFLTPEQWIAACAESGYAEVLLMPDVTRVRVHYPDFVVAAVVARKGP